MAQSVVRHIDLVVGRDGVVISMAVDGEDIGHVYVYWIEEMRDESGWYWVYGSVGYESVLTGEVEPVEGSSGPISQPYSSWDVSFSWMLRFAERKVRELGSFYRKKGQRVEVRRM